MKRSICIMAITMCGVTSLFAQGSMNAYNYSRTDIKGTARYMGMGGLLAL